MMLIPGKMAQAKHNEMFEKAFALNSEQELATTTSHARIAFYHILKAYSFPKESEILMTAINLPDMVNMIHLNGLKVKFIDYKKRSTDIDLKILEESITDNTKAFFYTHLYGRAGNVEEIQKLCKKKGIQFIQDNTQSVDCKIKDKNITNFADVSFYSLCDLKVIHTHRGGIITTNNNDLIAKIKNHQSTFENTPSYKYFVKFILEDSFFSFILKPLFFRLFIFQILKFFTLKGDGSFFDKITKGDGIQFLGFTFFENLFGEEGDLRRDSIPSEMKYRFTELQAQLGLKHLKTYKYIDQRRIEVIKLFFNELTDISKQHCLDWTNIDNHVFWKFPVFINDVEGFRKYLLKNSIDAAPTNLPCIPAETIFKTSDDISNTTELRQGSVCLPLYHYISNAQAINMARVVNLYFENN